MLIPKKEVVDDYNKISYFDDFLLIIRAWKVILSLGILGLIFSLMYLLITPNQYEAIANVVVGQISLDGSNIENPQSVVNRMNAPNSVDPVVSAECGLENAKSDFTQVLKAIKVSLQKGASNVIELRITRETPELAISCAKSVFEFISKTQFEEGNQVLKVDREIKSKKLIKINARLKENQELLAKAALPSSDLLPIYFEILADTRTLEDVRERLLAELDSKVIAASLQSPIYETKKPVRPQKMMVLAVGLFGGLFLGLIIALVRPNLIKLKSGMLKFQ